MPFLQLVLTQTWAVLEMPHYQTTLTISAVSSMYAVHSMHIFCMHGIPGLTVTFAEILYMYLKTLHGILFPRMQRSSCDISPSNA